MHRRLMMLAAVTLVGCPKPPAPAELDPGTQQAYEDLNCPEGTRPVGTPPPIGTQVWCVRRLANGSEVRYGPALEWHTNGQLAAKGEYLDGKRNGEWLFWTTRGVDQAQGPFVDGLEEGEWKFYHPNGQMESEGPMVSGGRHGSWRYWSEQGVENQGTWAFGEREGRWIEKDAEGTVVRERVYRAGRLIEQIEHQMER